MPVEGPLAGRRREYARHGPREIATALCLLLACLWSVACAATGEPANVLVIFSNSRLLPANVEFDRGLNDAADGSANVRFFAEFLDSPEFGGDSYA